MNKVKIEVPNGEWGSLNTKYPSDSDRVADNEFTAGTANVDTSVKGVLTKRLGGVDYASLGGAAKDQYEAIFSDGVRHLLTVVGGTLKYSSGDGQVNNVISGLTATVNNEFATTQDRVYFGNGVQKKVYDRVTSYGGVTYTFPTQTVKDMGCQTPASAPSVAVVAGGSVPVGTHKYKVTYVYYDSEESNGGLASAGATTSSGNQTVNLTSVPVGGYGVTQRKIYRDNNDDLYYLVGVIANNTATTFSDTLNAPTFAIPEDNNVPSDFTLINLYLDRLFIAGIPGDPYFISYSEPGFPDIFLSYNYIPCNQEDPITGMVVYLDRLIVFNRRSMGQILGRTSDQFRYAQIEGSVGCVDNRSIQIRVLNGVPVLIWLSDKGFYAYNGNSVVYISDKIEDQVNFNIQQSVIQKNKITHSDYTIFTQGTKTDGINLESSPGTITTKGPYWDTVAHPGASYEEQTNPKKLWDTQAEWENTGATKTDLSTKLDTAKIEPIQNVQFDAIESPGGSLSGDLIYSSGSFQFTSHSSFSGEASTNAGAGAFVTHDKLATRIVPSKSGYIVDAVVSNIFNSFPDTANVKIYSDSLGSPGVDLGLCTTVHLIAGTAYWLVNLYTLNTNTLRKATTELSGGQSLYKNGAGAWTDPGHPIFAKYTYNDDGDPKNGQWTSESYDSKSVINTNGTFQIVNSFVPVAGVRTITLTVEGSDTSPTSGFTSLGSFSYPLLSSVISTLNKRWFRVKLFMSTTDDKVSQTVSNIRVTFNTTGTWISEAIDCTSDVTSYDSFVISDNIPSGTSITYTIATSANEAGPWTGTGNGDGQFGPFGSAIVRQWVKIKAVLVRSGDTTVPSISSILFKYHLSATFISKSIDTGTSPSGWDIFQTSFETNSGTVVYSMRSATTEVGLAGATWYTVTNGTFPSSSLPVHQWVQWRAVITTNPDQIPTVDSVTINWFVGSSTQSIRCASIFYNTNYYLAVAEFESSVNNLLFIFDQEGKWRVYRNLNISTLSYFFNSPYFCDAITNKIVKFLQGTSDSGAVIPFEFRSKAFDFSADESHDDKVKILEKCIISGRNTGATYTVEYSVDDGDTFYALKDKDGNSTFTTSDDGKGFYKWLRPDFTSNIPSGYSVMLRIYNNDTKEVEIDGFKLYAFVRKYDPIE